MTAVVFSLPVAPIRGTSSATQAHGEIVDVSAGAFRVRLPSGEVIAKRATSCLIEPERADYVLVSCGAAGEAYVLAVLERKVAEHEERELTLAVDGNLRVAPTGRLDLVSEEVVVRASRGRLMVDHLSALGTKLDAQIADLRVVGEAIQSVYERIAQTVKHSLRVVEETDRVDVGDAAWSAKRVMSLHSENTLVTSEKLVKIDGEQVHLG